MPRECAWTKCCVLNGSGILRVNQRLKNEVLVRKMALDRLIDCPYDLFPATEIKSKHKHSLRWKRQNYIIKKRLTSIQATKQQDSGNPSVNFFFAKAKVNGTHPQSNMPHQSYRSQKASIKTRIIKWKTQGAKKSPQALATHASPTQSYKQLQSVAGGLLSKLSSISLSCPCRVPDVVGWVTSGKRKLNSIPCTMYHVPSPSIPILTQPRLWGLTSHDWRGCNDATDLGLEWSSHWWQSTIDWI